MSQTNVVHDNIELKRAPGVAASASMSNIRVDWRTERLANVTAKLYTRRRERGARLKIPHSHAHSTLLCTKLKLAH